MNELPIILHIESSSKNCSIAISKASELLCLCEESTDNFAHNEKLHSFIEHTLEGANLKVSDLNAVSISKGPGSYTGLRIGVAAAKGLCFALDIPLISIDTLQILISNQEHNSYDYLIPVIDARRMEIYTSIFDPLENQINPTFSHVLDESSFKEYINHKVCFVGDAALKVKQNFKNFNLSIKNFTFIEVLPSSNNMIELAYNKFLNQEFEDLAYFEPFYLKEFIVNK